MQNASVYEAAWLILETLTGSPPARHAVVSRMFAGVIMRCHEPRRIVRHLRALSPSGVHPPMGVGFENRQAGAGRHRALARGSYGRFTRARKGDDDGGFLLHNYFKRLDLEHQRDTVRARRARNEKELLELRVLLLKMDALLQLQYITAAFTLLHRIGRRQSFCTAACRAGSQARMER